MGELQQAKEEQGNLFGLLQLTKLERKTEKKQEIFFWDFHKVFQTHKKKARK